MTVKGTPEKASCSERNLHEPSTQTGGAFPTSYGDNTSSDDDMILDGVKYVHGLGVVGVYESEEWGGGRLIPSGLTVARLKDTAVDLNTTKLSNHCVLGKSSIQAVDVPEITATYRPQRAKTRKLASRCTSDPAATPLFPQNLTNVDVPAVATKSPANYGVQEAVWVLRDNGKVTY